MSGHWGKSPYQHQRPTQAPLDATLPTAPFPSPPLMFDHIKVTQRNNLKSIDWYTECPHPRPPYRLPWATTVTSSPAASSRGQGPQQRSGLQSPVGPLKHLSKQHQPSPVRLPGESHGQSSLMGYRPWGRSSRTRLSTSTTTSSKQHAPPALPFKLCLCTHTPI